MSRRRFLGAALGAALLVGATIPAIASAKSPHRTERVPFSKSLKLQPGALANKTADVLVELKAKPVALRVADANTVGRTLTGSQKSTIRAALKRTQDGLDSKITALGGRIMGKYQDALNGIKVRINLRQVSRLEALSGVAAVHPLAQYKIQNTHGVPYVGGPVTWGATGKTGLGVKIGIIDTGIDYYHANFGGSGDPSDFANDDSTIIEPGTFPTAKVAGGYDFAGDNYDASGDTGSPIPSPDPDPLDCNGHGSHVAGTAAGDGVLANGSTFTGPYTTTTVSGHSWLVGPGVAPKATIYAYRIFGCEGSSDLAVDAINRAVLDGVDVINMSFGSAFGRGDNADAIATNNAVAAGVVVVAAAGNESPNAYTVGSPATATGAIAAAALDALPSFPGASITIGSTVINGIYMNGPGDLPLTANLEVVSDGAGGLSLGCASANYAGFTPGNIAVVRRGTCAFVDKGKNAQDAGAAGIIVVNRTDVAGLPAYIGPSPLQFTIPMVGTAREAAPTLLAADGDSATLAATGTLTNPTYKQLASFSSGGPRSGDSALKPDVTAPGVSIVSTLVGGGTTGQTLSGTSMASPNTAGVAALVVQAHPTWTPSQVKAAIMNTADTSAGAHGILSYDPRWSGSGVVYARRAVDTVGLLWTGWADSSLSFGYDPRSTSYTEKRAIRITNTSGSSITYNLTRSYVGSSYGSHITVSPTALTVAAHTTRTVFVTASITAAGMAALPSAEAVLQQSVFRIRGLITATPTTHTAGRYTLHVPFLLVPRSVSAITAGSLAPYTMAGGSASSSFTISNPGNHKGFADVYQWGITDGYDGLAETDIRAVGFQSLPGEAGGLPSTDRLIGFAVNTWGRWSNAASNEIDVLINTDSDPAPEFAVIGIDEGFVLNADPNGHMVAFVVDIGAGLVVDEWNVIAPSNGSTAILYAAASDFGLASGDDPFGVSVQTFSATGLGDDSTAASALFDPWNPAVSQGDFIPLSHGQSVTEPAIVDVGSFEVTPALGWLVVANDDANGAAQADFVPIGSVPTP